MTTDDLKFIPHSDMSAEELDIAASHKKLIQDNLYDKSISFLNGSNDKKGFTAAVFNAIQNKLKKIQVYLLNKPSAETDEFYSITEPSPEETGNKSFWIKPY